MNYLLFCAAEPSRCEQRNTRIARVELETKLLLLAIQRGNPGLVCNMTLYGNPGIAGNSRQGFLTF